jgi:dihydrofolate reductase
MNISLIAAIAENNCIGKSGTLPWYIPEDLKHFKKITTGHTVLMGRKTWESIPEKFRPLPNRKNIVVTRQSDYSLPDGVELFHTIDNALAAHGDETVIVIGGAEIYKQTIGQADTLHITHIHKTIDGDAFFPEIDPSAWKETERDDHDGFSFVTYKRVRSS